MEMWGVIQIASLVLIVVLLVFIYRADTKLSRLEEKMKNKDKSD